MVHFNFGFQNFNSFADITLQLAKTLDTMEIPVSFEPSELGEKAAKIFTEDEKRLLDKWMHQKSSELFQIKWSHYWKKYFFQEMTGCVNLEFFAINYEFARNDEEFDFWIQDVVSNSSHKVAISHYCRNVLIAAGCPASNVSVVPLGFNPLIESLSPQKQQISAVKEGDKTILHMTNSYDLYRFGTDVLMKAYCEEFNGDSKVVLILKDGGGNPQAIYDLFGELSKEYGNSMPKFLWKGKLMSKEELAQLYLSSDAFIAPFRGEGFAIKVLDAFAAGLPVAMPLYGGPTDYGNEMNCYAISYDVVPVKECYDTKNLQIRNAPHWAEPNLQSVREQLRNILEDPNRYQVAQRARETAEKFTWEVNAKKLLKLLRDLL